VLPFEDEDDGDEAEQFDLHDPTPPEADVDDEGLVPGVDPPEAPAVGDDLEENLGEADDEVVRTFAISVLLTNVAVLAVSLGLMLIYFRGQWRLGGGLVVVGVLAQLRMYMHYREWKRSGDEADGGDTDATEPDDPAVDADGSGDPTDAVADADGPEPASDPAEGADADVDAAESGSPAEPQR